MSMSSNEPTSDQPGGAPSSGDVRAGVSVNAALPPISWMTDRKRLLWLGGLAAAGALGALEWPVVAAVGVGSYVAEQFAKSDIRHNMQQAQAPR